MCFAVGPERFVPRCGCSVTPLHRLRDARMDLARFQWIPFRGVGARSNGSPLATTNLF
jgi:hypothetical protein